MANWETEFVKIIREICAEGEIKLSSFDDWAFMLEKNGRRGFIYGYQFGLDNASAANVLKDKAAASAMMEAADIPHVPHWCVMNPSTPEFCSLNSGWEFLEQKLLECGELVVKDNLGTGGRLVYYVKTKKELEKACHDIFLTASSLAVSPFEKISDEYRLIMLEGKPAAAFRKKRPAITGDGKKTVKELLCEKIMASDDKGLAGMFLYEKQPEALIKKLKGDYAPKEGEEVLLEWKHNLGQGSKPELVTDEALLAELTELAVRVTDYFGLSFSSVDIIRTESGLKVLEINSGVMMENLAKTDDSLREYTKNIYRKAIGIMLK